MFLAASQDFPTSSAIARCERMPSLLLFASSYRVSLFSASRAALGLPLSLFSNVLAAILLLLLISLPLAAVL
eukprot:IDg18631t1